MPPSPSTVFLLLVPVHDRIFPSIIGEPMQPPYLQYPPFPPVTSQLSPTAIGELPMYDVLRIITLGEWPFEYSQYGQVSPLFMVLGTRILTFSSLVGDHTCSLDILPCLPTNLIYPTCSLILTAFLYLDSEELAPSDEETVLPVSPDTPPSLVLGITSPTCTMIPVKCPPLDILELGLEVDEPSPPSKGQVSDYLLVLLEVPDHSLLTPVASTEKWDCVLYPFAVVPWTVC